MCVTQFQVHEQLPGILRLLGNGRGLDGGAVTNADET